mgnify:CR=1 FL=1
MLFAILRPIKASNQQRFIWYGSSCLSSLSPDQRREEEQLRQQLHSTAQHIWGCTTPHVFFLLANMSSAMLIMHCVQKGNQYWHQPLPLLQRLIIHLAVALTDKANGHQASRF